ncbi:MAG: hypothetical protein GF309_15815 [Candidatus Lokiarchaeota archaeon]|nr:hypothetical protein [Candidatus Lokiarchaeota archaeon]
MNPGIMLQQLGRNQEAQEAYDEAEAADPEQFESALQQIQHQIGEARARMI